MANGDLVIGRDIVLEEFEPLSDLLNCLPLKAQFGPKTFVQQVKGIGVSREHGVKSLFTSLKEKAQDNLKAVKIEYTSFDVSYDAIVLGSSLGVVFIYDRTCRKLSKLSTETGHGAVTCVKLFPAQSFVAVGYSGGAAIIHSFVLTSQGFGRPLTLSLGNIHQSPVTCLEWSPDGTLLYSGDSQGSIFMTVVKVAEGQTQTALLFEESCPVVQISYSAHALLVSSQKRTVIWSFRDGSLSRVGQKERKSPGRYGACFYPPARPDTGSAGSAPVIYTARPGLRLWMADMEGKVSATLMYKGLLNENPPGIRTLTPVAVIPRSHSTAQFGPLLIYHGQFVATWDTSRIWVLDTSPCALVGFHSDFGGIVDVCAVGHELYVLLVGGERLIVRISLVPKLPNPLLDVSALFVNVTDNSAEDTNCEVNEVAHVAAENQPGEELTISLKGKEESEVFSEVTPQLGAADKGTSYPDSAEEDKEENPLSKFQKARAEDYGDIVFKKKRRTKRTKQNEVSMEHTDGDTLDETEADDLVNDMEELSDLSSELDSRDVSSSSTDQNSEGESSRLTEINIMKNELITNEARDHTDKSPPRLSESTDCRITDAHSSGQFELSKSPSNSSTNSSIQSAVYRPPNQCEPHVPSNLPPRAIYSRSVSVESLSRSPQSFSRQSVGAHSFEKFDVGASPQSSQTLCDQQSVSEGADQKSTNPRVVARSVRAEDAVSSTESPSTGTRTPASTKDSDADSMDDLSSTGECSHYSSRASFSQVYSSTPLNISDMTFSDASLDKSQPRSKKVLYAPPEFTDSTATVISHSTEGAVGSHPESTDSDRNTPPTLLDSEGAEELSDTASWPRSYSSRSLSYFEFSLSKDSLHEGTQPSPSSLGSQSSLLSESPKAKPNLRLLADSWADYATPSTGTVYHLAVSDRHLWCVTNYEHIYYCPTQFSPVTWTQLDGQAKMIAVNNTGDVIWCIDRKNYAHARKGVRDYRMTGRSWIPVEKDMRFVAVEETAVWGIKLNGDVFVRTDVSRDNPQGKGWRTVSLNTEFVQASCLDGLAWFVDKASRIHVYKGVDVSKTADPDNWEILPDVTAKSVCLGVEGVAWLTDNNGSVWFTGSVTRDNPTGDKWYQVSLGQYLMYDPMLHPILVTTLSTLSTLWSWVKRGDESRMLSASPKAGIWLLGRGGSLQASHGNLLGSRWERVAPTGIAQSVFWSYISVKGYKGGEGHMWAVQPNGELVCFQPGGRTVPVDSPEGAVLKLVAASSQGVWGITHNFRVVQRVGITSSCPEGYDWTDLRLHQFRIGKVYHLSCGGLTTWAVDDAGKIWVRIGGREETDPCMMQAWLQVEGSALGECRFTSVAVSGGDRVVWAVDDRSNVYARKDVTPSFPIGTAWELVPGMGVRALTISEHMVWASCPNGDIACRFGVSEHNSLGDYWKKVPGNFELISVTPDDDLWAINQDGQLFCRKTQNFFGSQSPFKARTYSTLFAGEDEWEFI